MALNIENVWQTFVQFQGSALFVFANFFEENLVLQSVGNVRGKHYFISTILKGLFENFKKTD